MANETWKFVQAKSKQAMKQVLGIKDEAARMKVTPPLAVAPLAHGNDMRWNPNDDGINFKRQSQSCVFFLSLSQSCVFWLRSARSCVFL